ncbi:MAG: OmpA family protein [Gammaproteobacteria bacterium]
MTRTGKLAQYFIPLVLLTMTTSAHSWWNPMAYPPPPPTPFPAPYYQPPAPVPPQYRGNNNQLAGMKAAMLSAQNESVLLKKEIARLHGVQKKLNADMNQLRAQRQSSSQQQSSRLAAVTAQLQQLENANIKKLGVMNQDYEAKIQALQTQLGVVNKKTQGLQSQLSVAGNDKQVLVQAQEKIASLESELNPLRGTYHAMQAEFDALKSAHTALNANLAQSQESMKSTDANLQHLLSEKEENAQQLAAVSAQRDELASARDVALGELESLKNEAGVLKATASEYTVKQQENVAASSAKDEKLNVLQGELTTLQAEMEGKASAFDNVQAQLAAMQGEMEGKASAFDNVQAQFTALQEQHANSKESEAQAASLSQELLQLRSSMETREQNLMGLTSERDTLATTIQTLKGQASEWQSKEQELSVLKDELVRSQEAAELGHQELVVAQEKLQVIGQEYEAAKQAAMQGKELEVQLAEFKEQCEKKDQSIVALNLEKEKLLALTTDSDNDGIADANDQCPDTETGSQVDAAGCLPDSDKDGVQDAADLCPESPAGEKANSVGCAAGETIVLSGVNFKYNSAEFTPNALPVLDDVTVALQKHPTVRVEIAGYTDSSGSDEANLALSQKRADAVWKYLTEKGIQASRLVSSGYGEMSPVADNTTVKGRASNRRVELHILSE